MPPRVRSTGPERDREVGLRIGRLMTARDPKWTYTELHNKILDVTKDDPDGPVWISAATLMYMVNGYYGEDGERKTRRITAGELYAVARAFGRSSDWFLGMEADDEAAPGRADGMDGSEGDRA